MERDAVARKTTGLCLVGDGKQRRSEVLSRDRASLEAEWVQVCSALWPASLPDSQRLRRPPSSRAHLPTQAYFIDLFVRPSNRVAVDMYERFGYSVFRTVRAYYAGGGRGGADEDGFGEFCEKGTGEEGEQGRREGTSNAQRSSPLVHGRAPAPLGGTSPSEQPSTRGPRLTGRIRMADMRKALARDVKRETVRDGKKGRRVFIEPE